MSEQLFSLWQNWTHFLWESLKIFVFLQTQYCKCFCFCFLFPHLLPYLSVREIYIPTHIFCLAGPCPLFQCPYINSSFKGCLLKGDNYSVWGQTMSLVTQRSITVLWPSVLQHASVGKDVDQASLAVIWKSTICLKKLRGKGIPFEQYIGTEWHELFMGLFT